MAKLNSVKKEEEVVEVEMSKETGVEVKYPHKMNGEKGLKGFASVNVTGIPVFINDILLYDGTDERDPFVSFPSHSYEKDGKKQWATTAGPASKETRAAIQEAVIECFTKMAEGEDVGDKFVHGDVTVSMPRLNPISSKENILLGCSVTTTLPVFVNNLSLRAREDGSTFATYPQRGYTDKNGERKWAAVAGPASTDTNKAITEALQASLAD